MSDSVASEHKTLVNRLGRSTTFSVDENALRELEQLRQEAGPAAPKFGILVVAYNAEDLILETIRRIPVELTQLIEEIFIFDDSSTDRTYEIAKELLTEGPWKEKLSVFRNPKNLGYGGNQKLGFRYARSKGYDYVVLLHGDGQYAPEVLPNMLLPILRGDADAVFGSRTVSSKDALAGGMPLYKLVGNKILTAFQNLVLGLSLQEFHTGYRIYSTATLESVAYVENSDGFDFDTEIIIQLRIADARIVEVPIQAFYGQEICHVNGMQYAFNVSKAVIQYRLHQLHLTRRAQFLLSREVEYTRKEFPSSSHRQILDLVEGPGRALDLGSSMGLLTEDLAKKGIRSVGVDRCDPEAVSTAFDRYVVCDLENYEELSFARDFDVILLADVVEHIRNAKGLLKHVRHFLKVDGSLVVSVPNIAIWFYRLSLLVGRFNYGPKGTLDETHVRFYTLDTIRSLLHECGYVVVEERFTGLPFEVVFESTGRSRLVRAMDWAYYQLVRLWPRLFGYQIILKTELVSLEAEQGEGRVELPG